jgi:hypothetical protein
VAGMAQADGSRGGGVKDEVAAVVQAEAGDGICPSGCGEERRWFVF